MVGVSSPLIFLGGINLLQIKLSTTHERKNLIVDENATPLSVLQQEDVVTDGATINLDGIPLSYQDLTTAFGILGVKESATLSVVVKTGNA